ncbi:CoA pyrophosphatase [Nocardia sp. NPDC004568]|uniref:NUDIX hydrolase n=1 Tax=Nocardia sp. NPDC004568 TaxID=3154551 RepID=UPI0033B3885F
MGADPGPRVPHDLDDFRTLARARLAVFPRIAVPDTDGLRRAAVVLCVVETGGSLSVLVIKRAYRGRNAGQWALPGGRVEPGETTQQAALRELHEELGLTTGPEDVLGTLDDFPASSGFAITPLVATLSDITRLHPNADEVHSVHRAAFDRLAADDTPHWVVPDSARMHDGARPGGRRRARRTRPVADALGPEYDDPRPHRRHALAVPRGGATGHRTAGGPGRGFRSAHLDAALSTRRPGPATGNDDPGFASRMDAAAAAPNALPKLGPQDRSASGRLADRWPSGTISGSSSANRRSMDSPSRCSRGVVA